MENAKKNLVFHFWGGRHASFPQKPVVKDFIQHYYFFFSGRELTLPFLSTSGFSKPILIPEAEGLGLTVPENDFCILDIPSGQFCQHFGFIFIVFSD